MTSQRYVIRSSQLWRGSNGDHTDEPNDPPYLIVTATTDELSTSGRVAGQLQVCVANANPEDFPIGRVVTISVH